MAQVIVRNLDEATVAALKTRAAAHGHSLEQELRLVLKASARRTRHEAREIADSIRGLGRLPVSADLDELLRRDRDR